MACYLTSPQDENHCPREQKGSNSYLFLLFAVLGSSLSDSGLLGQIALSVPNAGEVFEQTFPKTPSGSNTLTQTHFDIIIVTSVCFYSTSK